MAAPQKSSAPVTKRAGGKRAHRPQAERRAETGKKILGGTIKIINEQGLSKVTVPTVVAETGVSWGAVQYLFGAKHDLLVHICETAFSDFIDCLSALEVDRTLGLEERVRILLAEVNGLFQTPAFVAATTICEDPPRQPEAHKRLKKSLRVSRKAMDKVWLNFFDDLGVDGDRVIAMRHFAQLVLCGMSRQSASEDPLSYEWRVPTKTFGVEAFEILVHTMVQHLESD